MHPTAASVETCFPALLLHKLTVSMFNEGQTHQDVYVCLSLLDSLLTAWFLTTSQAHKGIHMPHKTCLSDFICSGVSRGSTAACKVRVMWLSEAAELKVGPPSKACALCSQLAFNKETSHKPDVSIEEVNHRNCKSVLHQCLWPPPVVM